MEKHRLATTSRRQCSGQPERPQPTLQVPESFKACTQREAGCCMQGGGIARVDEAQASSHLGGLGAGGRGGSGGRGRGGLGGGLTA